MTSKFKILSQILALCSKASISGIADIPDIPEISFIPDIAGIADIIDNPDKYRDIWTSRNKYLFKEYDTTMRSFFIRIQEKQD